MKYCKKCKKDFSDEDKFCQDCGGKLVKIVESKESSKIIKYGLIIVLIALVLILGFLTGIINIPHISSTTTTTTSTTIVLTTTSTITPITISTTIPKVPCSPCFGYFVYIDHSSSNLRLRNGGRAVTINNVNFGPNQDIELSINCPDISCNVEVVYKDTDTGITHTDSATLHTLTSNIQLMDAYCQDNTIIFLINNIGNSPISSLSFYVNGVGKSEISGCLNNPLLPGNTINCQVVGISGLNQVRIVSPSNVAVAAVECTIKPIQVDCSKVVLDIVDALCHGTTNVTVTLQDIGSIPLTNPIFYFKTTNQTVCVSNQTDTITAGGITKYEINCNFPRVEVLNFVRVSALCGLTISIYAEKSDISDPCS